MDQSIWKLKKLFSVEEAAFYICDGDKKCILLTRKALIDDILSDDLPAVIVKPLEAITILESIASLANKTPAPAPLDTHKTTIQRENLERWCISNDLNPAFLVPSGHVTVEAKASERDIDVAACQAIAMTLWHEDPEITITAIEQHPLMTPYKKKWKGEKTIRDWIKHLNPKKGRPGRPRKTDA